MGFETQKEAERWAEDMEFRADQLKEERMLNPKLNAWLTITELPSYKDMPVSTRALQKAVFEFAWQAATKAAAGG